MSYSKEKMRLPKNDGFATLWCMVSQFKVSNYQVLLHLNDAILATKTYGLFSVILHLPEVFLEKIGVELHLLAS
jgi:hypothetical protein